MIWVGWRQQRTETLIAVGILAVLAAVLVPTGIQMTNSYSHADLAACLGSSSSEICNNAISSFVSRYSSLNNLTSWFTLVPGLIGVLVAASLVLELENGTYRLAWTQSITRRRWIATKLGVAIATALVATLALTLLVTWWRTPLVHLNGRMDNSVFDFEGIVPFGYVLFAVGLALAIGVVWRRTVAALVVAFMGYVLARVLVDTWLRQRFVAPISATWRESAVSGSVRPTHGGAPANLYHALIINQFPSDRLGHQIRLAIGPCVRLSGSAARILDKHCLAQHSAIGYTHAVYQPADRFWLFQGIETALFGGVALALIAFAAWWTYRRTV